ncbi:MAG: VPLPA-CTERM sorting domain-containing protein [Desulfobacca sp.]|nr:VPLPA-CTERM sorting domain-containing protein [Desulfobacca sp.]
MKKTFIVLVTVLALGLMAGGAGAYDYPNNTLIQGYYKDAPYGTALGAPSTPQPPIADSVNGGYWYDRIGASIYEVYGVDVSATTMSIYTNMPAGGDTTYSVPVADLFFDSDLDGTWDYAIEMNATNQGNIYDVSGTAYQTSQDIYGGTSGTLVYGGRWDSDQQNGSPFSPAAIPVNITASNALSSTNVSWNQLTTGNPDWCIDIILTDTLKGYLTADYAFIWGSGQCANDTAQGKVPLPGGVLLLGAMMGRLVCYARRRRQELP